MLSVGVENVQSDSGGAHCSLGSMNYEFGDEETPQRIDTIGSDVVPSIGGYMDIIRIIFAIILPPVGVFLQVGLGLQFWINILLTLLGYIPGIIHAIWIIATR